MKPVKVSILPIQSFSCVYLLRSLARPRCTYIGSTVDPRRRLDQHNGVIKGGSKRTCRKKLRPWEMVCMVTGFPSWLATLQFEYVIFRFRFSILMLQQIIAFTSSPEPALRYKWFLQPCTNEPTDGRGHTPTVQQRYLRKIVQGNAARSLGPVTDGIKTSPAQFGIG